MARTIITHVGASLLQEACGAFRGYPERDELLSGLAYSQDVSDYHEGAAAYLAKELAKRWGERHPDRLRNAPAEIASLSLVERQDDDRIALLYSDTPEGAFCAEVLKLVLGRAQEPSHGLPFCKSVETYRLTGLQVTDQPGPAQATNADARELEEFQKRFVRKGLSAYVGAVWNEYLKLVQQVEEDAQLDQSANGLLLFNITAGYKGLVPIARDVAMLLPEHTKHRKCPIATEVCYLYEASDRLIPYAGLPVQFNWRDLPERQLAQAAAVEDKLAAAATVGPDEQVQASAIDKTFQRYFEPASKDSPDVHLSPLGRVVWELARRLKATYIASGHAAPELPVSEHGVMLPGGALVRLAVPEAWSNWVLVNHYGEEQPVRDFQPVLQQPSYSQEQQRQTVALLQSRPSRVHELLPYSGDLIDRLYLQGKATPVAWAERAARLCRLLIAYCEAANEQPPLPGLWRSYRRALGIMEGARDVLRRRSQGADEGERLQHYRLLLGQHGNSWLGGWDTELDNESRRAQRELAIRVIFREVELHVEAAPQGGAGYKVQLRVEDWGQPAEGSFALDPEALLVSNAQAYGRLLGEALFGGAVREAYRQVQTLLDERGERARVLLRIDPPELREHKWERLYHPTDRGWEPMAIAHQTPLARVVEVAAERELAASGELKAGLLRVLVVIASPTGLSEYKTASLSDPRRLSLPPIEEERAEYHALFAELPELSVTMLESGTARAPTLHNLLDELRKGYDIVHLVCHGVLSYAQGSLDRNDYRLLLENELGAVEKVHSADLKRSLAALAAKPQLWVLAACESGAHNGDAAFVPLGEDLVVEGLAERVIAMNGQFGIVNAGRFAGRLYRQLLAHRLIDLAVNEAREQLGREEDYGTPVLFRA